VLKQCYGCNGTGLASGINDGDYIMTSRYGYYEGDPRIYKKCPICKGSGYINRIE